MPGALYQQEPVGALSLGSGLNLYQPAPNGIAPFGLRYGGSGAKGLGYFGMLPNVSGGPSTELSAEFDSGGKTIEHPLLVPTLNNVEIMHLLAGLPPTPEIYDKAQSFALQRIGMGLSPFAGPTDLRYPVPK